MKFCPSCGKPYEERVRFCDGCGAALTAQQDTQPTPPAKPVIDDDEQKTVFLGDVKPASSTEPPTAPPTAPPVAPPVPPVVPPVAPPVPPVVPPTAPVNTQALQKKKKAGIKIAIFVAVIILGVLFGIFLLGNSDSSDDTKSKDNGTSTTQQQEEEKESNNNTSPTKEEEKTSENPPPSPPADSGEIAQAPAGTTKLKDDALSYVLIYNPSLYDERLTFDPTSLRTGDFNSSQIDIDTGRGDSPEETEYPFYTMSQGEFELEIPDLDIEMDRAGNYPGINYSLGDKKTFYHATNTDVNKRTESEFECVYAGKYCYIWVIDKDGVKNVEKFGKVFDEDVYESCVDMFGTPRFVGDSGKVNIFIYDLPRGLGGFFHGMEIYSEKEFSQNDINLLKDYKMNMDHAIIHINSTFINDNNYYTCMCGTLAHEFQHLIYRCNSVDSTTAVWLNEAMSGYIEEQLFPGGKAEAGHFSSFGESSLIRHGQSLYNFNSTSFDIGVYGSVYYYTEYLKKITGDDVIFTDIHNYWKDLSEGSEAEAIYDAVDSSTKSEIDGLITYPDEIKLEDEEEWMSKLTLDFYLNILSNDMALPNMNEFNASGLLYDELGGTSIEGGGRIILSVKNGEFDIPSASQDGLIYIGLDKDFNVVTDYIYK